MSHRKLFLGGLTKSTTTEHLFEVFSRYGLVVDAVVMERNGVPRGFGFVTFKDESSLSAVLADKVKVDGREVDIKRAVPEEEMEFAPTKVFVGGLSQSVDRASLKAHFEKFGDVRDAVVMMDRTTGRSRGFGFVRFAQPEAVEMVLANPQVLDGQVVDVKHAQPADTLPPPKYPRSRAEEAVPHQTAARRTRRGRDAPDASEFMPEMPPVDMMTATWMAQLLQMQQSMAAMQHGFYPGMGMPGMGMPGMFDPSYGFGFDPTMFPTPPIEVPAAFTLPEPDLTAARKALASSLLVETESKEEAPLPESSPLGDLSNRLQSALDGKSPTKTRTPQVSPMKRGGENGPLLFTSDMKSAMKEAGLQSIMQAAFPQA